MIQLTMFRPQQRQSAYRTDIEALKDIELVRTRAKEHIKEAKEAASEARILLKDATHREQHAEQDIRTAESTIAASTRYLQTLEHKLRYDRSLRNLAIREATVRELNTATEAKRSAKARRKAAGDDILDAEQDKHSARMKELRSEETLQSTECEWLRLLQRIGSRGVSGFSTNSSTVSDASSSATNMSGTSASSKTSASTSSTTRKKKIAALQKTKTGKLMLATLT